MAGTQFAHNGLGFALSGDGESHSSMDLGEFWAYDPVADSGPSGPPTLAWSRWAPASFVIDDDVYLMQGMSYDPGHVRVRGGQLQIRPGSRGGARCGGRGVCRRRTERRQRSIHHRRGNPEPRGARLRPAHLGNGGGWPSGPLHEPWTGALSPYETALVVLGTYDLNDGRAFELVIVEDGRQPHQQQLVVEPPQPTEGYVTCEVTVITDNWGDETGWEIESDNAVVASGSGYDDNAMYTVDVTLPGEGCYELVLNDSYGDGMVGNWGSVRACSPSPRLKIPGNPFTDYNVFEYGGGFEFSQVTSNVRRGVVQPNLGRPRNRANHVFPTPPARRHDLVEWNGVEGGRHRVTAQGQTVWRLDTLGSQTRRPSHARIGKQGVYTVQVRTQQGLRRRGRC